MLLDSISTQQETGFLVRVTFLTWARVPFEGTRCAIYSHLSVQLKYKIGEAQLEWTQGGSCTWKRSANHKVRSGAGQSKRGSGILFPSVV